MYQVILLLAPVGSKVSAEITIVISTDTYDTYKA